MPIDGLPSRSANKDAVRSAAARHTRPAAVRYARRGALDHDLVALLQTVGDFDELIVLYARLDHARRGLAGISGEVDYLVTSLAPHRPQRDDEHVVLFVDGDRRRGSQTTWQGLVAVVDADRYRVRHHPLRQGPTRGNRDDFAAQRATRHGVERDRSRLADGDLSHVRLVDGHVH